MAYCDLNDLKNAVGEAHLIDLTNDTGGATVDTDKINAAISDADSIIDGFIRKRYAVPLQVVPPFVNKIAVDLAVYALFRRRAPAFDMPQWVGETYDRALDFLNRINRAEIDLGIEPPPAKSAAVVAQTSQGSERLFTNTTLEDF